MTSRNRSFEQRHHVRYRLKDTIFIVIQGNYFDPPPKVADLNRNGVGFYSAGKGREPTGKIIIFDLISGRNRAILRSLAARIVFTSEASPHKNDPNNAQKRYGLEFVNLSALEKRQLDLITKKYALLE